MGLLGTDWRELTCRQSLRFEKISGMSFACDGGLSRENSVNLDRSALFPILWQTLYRLIVVPQQSAAGYAVGPRRHGPQRRIHGNYRRM